MTDGTPEILTRTVSFEPEAWLDLNTAVKRVTGDTFEQLAERSPLVAYAFFRSGLLHLVELSSATRGNNPRDEVYQKMTEFYPEELTTTTEFDVQLFETMAEDGTELRRTHDREATTILKFTVEPLTNLFD